MLKDKGYTLEDVKNNEVYQALTPTAQKQLLSDLEGLSNAE